MVGIVQVLGGLALFLYGIELLISSIENLAGNRILVLLAM